MPEHMQLAAKDAYETLLHTKDGQRRDIIIDRATLDAIYEAGQASKEKSKKSIVHLLTTIKVYHPAENLNKLY